MTPQCEEILSGGSVAELHLVVKARGDEAAAVRAERQTQDSPPMTAQGEELLATGGIPELHAAASAAGCNATTVGAERHGVHT